MLHLLLGFWLALGALSAQAPPAPPEGKHALQGRVVNSDRAPMPAFKLRAIGDVPKPEGGRRRVEVVREFKDANGAFSLSELESGNWRLEAEAEGHAVAIVPRVRLGQGAPPATPLQLVLFKEARLKGTVVDAKTGAPVEGARISARLHLDQRLTSPLENLPPALSAKDGTFTLGGFAPGVWELRIEKEGYLVQDGQRFDPTEGQEVGSYVARLAVGGIVSGRAVLPESGPIEGAEVLVIGARGVLGRAKSAEDGSFSIPLVRPGRHRVEVRRFQGDSVGPVELAGPVIVIEGQSVVVELAKP